MEMQMCQGCNGSGWYEREQAVCPACGGLGEVETEDDEIDYDEEDDD